jgi:hypothetical protein
MSDSSSVTPFPLVRDCQSDGLRPLLAPGGRDTYFSPDLQRLLLAADEPLARFLPPARWVVPDRQAKSQSGAGPHVVYTVPDDIIRTAKPLRTLPRSEIEAFAGAVAHFLAKSRPEAKDVPPHIRQCRHEFRLPDPAIDTAAYWEYGSEFDRRLLVLWGCEPYLGCSLPTDQAVARLREREMAWSDKEELALKLARRTGEPLARFLASRAPHGGLIVGGTAVPAQKLRRLKHLSPKESAAFKTAAQAFYAKAHPGTPGISPFEQELRREFRLPGLDESPKSFFSWGSKLVIVLDPWPRDVTLPATADPVLKLPDIVVTCGTVSEQLQLREVPLMARYLRFAVAAALLLLGVAAWWIFRPASNSIR